MDEALGNRDYSVGSRVFASFPCFFFVIPMDPGVESVPDSAVFFFVEGRPDNVVLHHRQFLEGCVVLADGSSPMVCCCCGCWWLIIRFQHVERGSKRQRNKEKKRANHNKD